jgi:TolB-like protein/DNA-binding winged helix-turn-helix (wHTH) protein
MADIAARSPVPGIVRFGPDFEFDPALLRLSRSGRILRVERIPLELLSLLVERRAELVTRQEIAERIWGKDTFLDTDNSINGAVRKIRSALRDDPESPRYIETITAKGYRFIGEVHEHASAATTPSAALPDAVPNLRHRVPPFRYRIAATVALLVVAIGVLAYASWPHKAGSVAAGTPSRRMLAVLPFDNLTGDPSQEYFSDGLTEEMISHIGNLDPQHLSVIARTSVMRFKGNKADLRQLAKDLGVQYALEGSVRRDTGTVRVTAQLIELNGFSHVWARQYDRELTNLLVLQDDIARAIAHEIQLSLVNAAGAPGRPRPENLTQKQLAAYDLYLRGRHFWNMRTQHGFAEALHFFAKAIEEDPSLARAYAGLSDTNALLSSYGLGDPSELMPRARAAALKAITLDDGLAEAHASFALVSLNYDWDWATAEHEYRRAIELDPNYATAYHWYAEFLAEQGRFDEALAAIGNARRLDPLSLIMAVDHGAILYYARKYDQAITQFRQVLASDPAFPRANLIAFAYAEQSRFDEALASARAWRDIEVTPWTYGIEAFIRGRTNQPELARQSLQQLQKTADELHLDPVPMLIAAHIGMGNKSKAIDLLEDCYRHRSHQLTVLKVDPLYDSLRDEPRFRALLARVGFRDAVATASLR